MGSIMAAYSALFLFLLEGEKVMDELRHRLRGRRWFQRHALLIAERRDRVGALQRALSIPASVMLMGPFWRAVTYHVFRMPHLLAYACLSAAAFPTRSSGPALCWAASRRWRYARFWSGSSKR